MRGKANNMTTKQQFATTEHTVLIAQLLSPEPQTFTKINQVVLSGGSF